ncbi:MAG: dTDP-glucose 4,6-dehydratase, partial [Candidatus Omnitrophica bacterium]|nr:dTDP-glucose 4,6-dehydratase [Candidatus Omnitrophota bacterium]
MKILITGGAGFIGSEFVRQLMGTVPAFRGLSLKKIIVVDKLTYAGDLKRLQITGIVPMTGTVPESAIGSLLGDCPVKCSQGTVPEFKFYKSDICNKKAIESIFKKEKPNIVVNFSAETHVDRSIQDSSPFISTNIQGTQVLLDCVRKYKIEKLIHISTDEVYGDIEKGKFNEDSPLIPNSPYSASKAAADLLIKSYVRTYGFPAVIVRPSNNYGPWQYPEKLIPVVIYKALKNEAVPVYAKGMNVREWLYVSDCAKGIQFILKKGKIGEVYNLGSGQERTNLEVVKKILDILGKPHSLIKFVQDRPGHDVRYSLDSSQIRRLGWKPEQAFD